MVNSLSSSLHVPVKFEPSEKHKYEWELNTTVSQRAAFNRNNKNIYADQVMKAVLVGNRKLLASYFEKNEVEINLQAHMVTLKNKEEQEEPLYNICALTVCAFIGPKETVELLLAKCDSTALENYLSHYFNDGNYQKPNLIHEDCHKVIVNHMLLGANRSIINYRKTLEKLQNPKEIFERKLKELWKQSFVAQKVAFQVIDSNITVTVLTEIVMSYVFDVPEMQPE